MAVLMRDLHDLVPKPSSSLLSRVQAMGVTECCTHCTYQRYNAAAMDRIGQINVLDLRWQRIVSSYHVVDPERS